MKIDTRIPDEGLLRLKEIIGDPNANPPIVPLVPVGRSTWWAGVKSGRFPKPIKLGPRTTAWRGVDIRELVNGDGVLEDASE